jgi:hypothetical protein
MQARCIPCTCYCSPLASPPVVLRQHSAWFVLSGARWWRSRRSVCLAALTFGHGVDDARLLEVPLELLLLGLAAALHHTQEEGDRWTTGRQLAAPSTTSSSSNGQPARAAGRPPGCTQSPHSRRTMVRLDERVVRRVSPAVFLGAAGCWSWWRGWEWPAATSKLQRRSQKTSDTRTRNVVGRDETGLRRKRAQ